MEQLKKINYKLIKFHLNQFKLIKINYKLIKFHLNQ